MIPAGVVANAGLPAINMRPVLLDGRRAASVQRQDELFLKWIGQMMKMILTQQRGGGRRIRKDRDKHGIS
jgi:hypothetical protein